MRQGSNGGELREGLCIRASGVCKEDVLAEAFAAERSRRQEHLAAKVKEVEEEEARKEKKQKQLQEAERRKEKLEQLRAKRKKPDPLDKPGTYVVGAAGATVRLEEALTSPVKTVLKAGEEVEIYEVIGRRAHLVTKETKSSSESRRIIWDGEPMEMTHDKLKAGLASHMPSEKKAALQREWDRAGESLTSFGWASIRAANGVAILVPKGAAGVGASEEKKEADAKEGEAKPAERGAGSGGEL